MCSFVFYDLWIFFCCYYEFLAVINKILLIRWSKGFCQLKEWVVIEICMFCLKPSFLLQKHQFSDKNSQYLDGFFLFCYYLSTNYFFDSCVLALEWHYHLHYHCKSFFNNKGTFLAYSNKILLKRYFNNS